MRDFLSHAATKDPISASSYHEEQRHIVQQLKTISRIAQGVIYIFASIFHFVTDFEMQIIPTFLPWRRAALYITGIFEFLGGLGLLIPRFQRSSSWGLAALLVAIWPANVYHAVIDKDKHMPSHRFYHWLRQPMQIVLILWVLWSTSQPKDV